MKNDLTLEKSPDTIGYYRACVHLEGEFFVGIGNSWKEAIDELLEKINWYFN